VVEREKVALKRCISLETIGEEGEGGAKGLGMSSAQIRTRGGEEQRVNTASQHSPARLDRLPHKPRPLTEEVHDKIAW
jgi:hypothetical protein